MATFAQFKTSIIKNYELIVKTLTRKLKDGSIVVGHASTADNALNAVSADNSLKLEGKTIQEILSLAKNSSDSSFETLSNNLKDYDGKMSYYSNGKIDRITYKFDNYKFEKIFTYRSDGRPEKIIFISNDFDMSTILSKNCKTLVYDSNGKLVEKQYSLVI